jgi:UDP-glucose 4-epimerase
MKVLVTGGAGFIGANLVRELESRNAAVSVIDDLSNGLSTNLDGTNATFTHGSITDPAAVQTAIDGCEAVVHLAALGSVPRSIATPLATHHANVDGTLCLLEACRRINARIVFSSSSSVYGANPTLPKAEHLLAQPMSPYAVSKLSAEQYVLSYGRCYGIPTLAFRFFNVFGPLQRADHQYAAVIPKFIDAVLRDEAPVVHGDGLQSRDFTFVGDVTQVLARAVLEKVTHDGPVNLAFGRRLTLLDVLAQLGGLTGAVITPRFESTRPGDVPHSQAANDLLRSLFPGLDPVAFDVALERTLDWMKTVVLA